MVAATLTVFAATTCSDTIIVTNVATSGSSMFLCDPEAADVKNGDLFKSGVSLLAVAVAATGSSETSSYTKK